MATPATTYTDDSTPLRIGFVLKTSDGKFVETLAGLFILFSDSARLYTSESTSATTYTED